jgi:HSP20 family protein
MLTTLTARVLESSNRSSGARLDAYRVDGTFFVDIDLPGVDAAAVDITVDGEVMTVRAERRHPGREDPRAVIAGRRQVLLSEKLDIDRLEARYDDGVLTLSIPVHERPARRVEPAGVSARTAASSD